MLGETYLSSDISDDENFIGFGKNPFREDDSSGLRKRGVGMYFKENLTIKRRIDLETLCVGGIVTEITLHPFCGPLSTTWHVMKRFCSVYATFRLLDYIRDEKTHCIIFTGDFSCRSQQWWPGDTET